MKPEMGLYYLIPLDQLRDTKSFAGGEEAVKAEGGVAPVCPSGNLGGLLLYQACSAWLSKGC